MATASINPVGTQYENWLRIITLVHYGGNKVCLDILHRQEGAPIDGGNLYKLLLTKQQEFQKLLKKGTLKQNQYDLIFPTNQFTSTVEFDITLFTLVISVLYGKKYKAIIDDLRKWRNGEFHKGNISFTSSEFNNTWNDVTTTLGNHGLNISLVADLKHCVLDTQSAYRNAYLEALALRYKFQIDDNKRRIDQNLLKIDCHGQEIIVNKQEIVESKQKITENKQRLDDSESKLSDNNQRIDQNVLEINCHGKEIIVNKQEIVVNKQKITENKQRLDDSESNLSETQNQMTKVTKKVDDLTKEFEHFQENKTDSHLKDLRFMVQETAPNFFGREDTLNKIYEKFSTNSKYRYNAVVLTGLGGIGKSQISAQYTELHWKQYDATIWLDVSDIEGSLNSLLHSLKVQCSQNKSVEVLTQLLCHKLYHDKCLIILDDASNKKSLDPLLKNLNFSNQPSILITSQNDKWKMSRIHQIRVDVFTQTEAEKFLQKELKEEPSKAICELADSLQSFPLAMQQAVCYMNVNNMKISKYLHYFKANNKKLLDINIEDYGITEYDKTLLTVWEIAFEKLKENEKAVQVIGMMAYMDHRYINKNTFLQFDSVNDEISLNEVVRVLSEYSLITSMQNKYLKIHPLVQKILKYCYQDNNECLFSLKHLLMKLGSASQDYLDSDEENMWYPHVKMLLHEDDDIRKWLIETNHVFNVAVNRFDVPLLTDILNIRCITFENRYLHEKSKNNFEFLVLANCDNLKTLFSRNDVMDCLKIISNFETKYVEELKFDNIINFHWRIMVVNVLLLNNQINEARVKYPSPHMMRFSLKSVQRLNLYYLMISNSYQLGRRKETLMLCKELLDFDFTNEIEKLRCCLQVAEIFCICGYYDEALSLMNGFNRNNDLMLPQNHYLFLKQFYFNGIIHAGHGNYKIALSALEKYLVAAKNNGQLTNYLTSELWIARIYIETNEYKKCEFILENQINQYGRFQTSLHLFVVVKLLLRKFEDVIDLLKTRHFEAEDEIHYESELYMALYKGFENKRLTGTYEEVNKTLACVIAMQKDFKEKWGCKKKKEFIFFNNDFFCKLNQ